MSISTLKGHKGSTIQEIPLWIPVKEVESQALDQLRNIASLPWVAKMAVMPDCHLGKGATVGSVIATRGAISPAAVGVDIGCGMGACLTNLNSEEVVKKAPELRSELEKTIPVGFNSHKEIAFHKAPQVLRSEINCLLAEYKTLSPGVQKDMGRVALQIGTLGGGNHFIELNRDTDDNIWMMLHSGSRWIGNILATIHIRTAKLLEHNVGIRDKDLSSFLANTPEMEAYRRDLYWAQRYAMFNRRVMMWLYTEAVKKFFPQLTVGPGVWCHHNYVAEEFHYGEKLFVTRKGAINAEAGNMGIIPGAMGAKSYIVRGLGCEESLCSAPHGAGRRMSRSAAKRAFTVEDVIEQTMGVECRKDKGIIDEIPGSYKDISQVIQYSSELVEIVVELLPALICVKG